MHKFKLYYSPWACSLAPHVAFHELGIDFEAQRISFAGGDLTKPEFLKLNPLGAIPVIVTPEGQPLTEGAAILQYLGDLKPEAGLLPKAGTFERAFFNSRLSFVATEMHKGLGAFYSLRSMASTPAGQEEVRKFLVDSIGERLDIVDGWLTEQPYLTGPKYSLADAYLWVVLNWAEDVKVDLAKYAAIGAFMKRVEERPAVRKALQAEK